MGDIVGRLFREFAVTLSVTILVSAVVSLTLTPMMCAQAAAARARRSSKGGSTAASERAFEAVIDFYGRTLRLGAAAADGDADGRGRDAGADHRAVRRDPQGILPDSGYRRHPGHLRGGADRLVPGRWPARSSSLAKVILTDPAVESLSSFIGIDGTNTTLNSGRIQINLKPLDGRAGSARATSSAACSRSSPRCPGITLFMQPVQDLTGRRPRQPHAVSVHPRRSERRRVECLRAADGGQAAAAAGAARRRQRSAGARPCGRSWCSTATPPRGSASRCGHRSDALRRLRPAADLDDVHAAEPVSRRARSEAGVSEHPSSWEICSSQAWTAAGRQASSRVASLRPPGPRPPRQHHASAAAQFDSSIQRRLRSHALQRLPHRGKCRCAHSPRGTGTAPITINHQGQFPVVTLSFNLAPGASLGDAVDAIDRVQRRDRHAAEHAGRVSGHGRRRSRRRWPTSRC